MISFSSLSAYGRDICVDQDMSEGKMTPRYFHLTWLRIFPLISNGAGDLIQEKSNARWQH